MNVTLAAADPPAVPDLSSTHSTQFHSHHTDLQCTISWPIGTARRRHCGRRRRQTARPSALGHPPLPRRCRPLPTTAATRADRAPTSCCPMEVSPPAQPHHCPPRRCASGTPTPWREHGPRSPPARSSIPTLRWPWLCSVPAPLAVTLMPWNFSKLFTTPWIVGSG